MGQTASKIYTPLHVIRSWGLPCKPPNERASDCHDFFEASGGPQTHIREIPARSALTNGSEEEVLEIKAEVGFR